MRTMTVAVVVFGGLMLAALACGPIDVAREILSRLPTATPTASSERHETTIWYVAIDGDDGNRCQELSDPCRTINEVLRRVTDDDQINIGPGTFAETGSSGNMLRIADLNLVFQGAGRDATVLDGEGERTPVLITGDSSVTVRGLTVRNSGGSAPGDCIAVRTTGNVQLTNVLVEDCVVAGIGHPMSGMLRLVNVTVRQVREGDGIGGATGLSSSGRLIVEGGEFSDNEGAGVGSSGSLELRNAVIDRNGLEGLVVGGEAIVEDVTLIGNNIHPTLGANHAGLLIGESANATVRRAQIQGNDIGVRVLPGGRLRLENSNVSGHPRNGVMIDEGGTATLVEVSVSDNGSLYAGTSLPAGIDNQEGDLTMIGSVVEGNHNGGIGNYGDLTMRDSTVRANTGNLAGLFNMGDAEVSGSLFAGQRGGEPGVENRGVLELVNSTVSGNDAIGVDAVSPGGLTLRYVTIADNGTIGLNSHEGGTNIALIHNSIIAKHSGRSDCLYNSIAPTPSHSGVNFDSDGSCRFSDRDTVHNLALSPLQDNGGPTWTHAIEGDSDALDAAEGDCPATDQRGGTRPFGIACDVGAYELGPVVLSGTAAPDLLTTVTPTPSGSLPTVANDTLCWQGPGPLYQVVSSLSEGTQVTLLGRGAEGNWWVIDSPRYPGVACWVEDDDLSVDPLIALDELRIFAIPPLPTPTATPILGCLYQGPNDNQAACYPIDQCPVDFEDSQGACTP